MDSKSKKWPENAEKDANTPLLWSSCIPAIMLQYIEDVKIGSIKPAAFVTAETTKRSYALELSKFKDFEFAHTGGVNDISVEQIEGRFALSGGSDGSVVIHDLENLSGTPKFTCKVACHVKRKSKYAHKFSVESVQWYPFDTGIFTSSSTDKNLKIWDTNRMKPADVISLDSKIYCHQMSPVALKHNLVAAGTSKEHVQLIDLKSGCNTHELRGHKGSVLTVAWSTSDEHLLASGSVDNKVILWDIRSARGKLKSLDQHNGDSGSASSQAVNTAHSGAVNSIKFNEQGNMLVSYGTDNRIRVWDAKTGSNTMVNFGKVYNDVKRNVKMDVSTNTSDELIFVPSETDVVVFELHTGMRVNTLLGHFNSANCCAYNTLTQELYSGGNDRNILLWTPDTEQEKLFDDHITLSTNKRPESNVTINCLNRVTADNWSSSDED